MLRNLLTSKVISENALIPVRLITGSLIMVHGFGIFNPGHMNGNIAWLSDIHFPLPVLMTYLGKGAELVGGIMLILGMLTRFASLVLVINMAVITFVLGSGKIFEEDQPAFLFLLLFICLFIAGGGRYSLDKLWFDKS